MPKYHQYYIYVLKCADNTYYTGVTNNLIRRFGEHTEGISSKAYTFKRRPLQLVFWEEFSNIEFAIEKEKQIKKWSKKKKEALIQDEYEKLPDLSKKKFEK